MKKNLFLLVMACVGMLFVGCDPVEQKGGETQIKSITIKNTTCEGTVDNTAFTVLFEAATTLALSARTRGRTSQSG